MGQGLLREINGCISTGKEANVYHAAGRGNRECEEEQELAVKVGAPLSNITPYAFAKQTNSIDSVSDSAGLTF